MALTQDQLRQLQAWYANPTSAPFTPLQTNIGGNTYGAIGVQNTDEGGVYNTGPQSLIQYDPNQMGKGDPFYYIDPSTGQATMTGHFLGSDGFLSGLGDSLKSAWNDNKQGLGLFAALYGMGSLVGGGLLGAGGASGAVDPALAVQGNSINALDAATGVPYGSEAALAAPNTAAMGAGAGSYVTPFSDIPNVPGLTDSVRGLPMLPESGSGLLTSPAATAAATASGGLTGSGATLSKAALDGTNVFGANSVGNALDISSLVDASPGLASDAALSSIARSLGYSAVPDWLKMALKVGGPLAGGLLGSRPVTSTATESKDIAPWLKPYVIGQGGLLDSARDLFNQQKSDPSIQAGWKQIQSTGLGLLSRPVAGNPFTSAPTYGSPSLGAPPMMPQQTPMLYQQPGGFYAPRMS